MCWKTDPPAFRQPAFRQHGVTLVELVMAVVIISIAVTGVLLAYVQAVRNSADPMINAQALAIAEAYMDEILAKPVAGTAGCTAGVPRASCGTVGAYAGISGAAPSDQFGNAIAGLTGYTVTVGVSGSELGVGDSTVVVTVAHASGQRVTLRSHTVDF